MATNWAGKEVIAVEVEAQFRALVAELDQPGFFDNLDEVLEWFTKLYAIEWRTPSNAGDPGEWMRQTASDLFRQPPGFSVGRVLEAFARQGLMPFMHVGYDGPSDREIRAKYLIGQALADISSIDMPWWLDDRWTVMVTRYQERYPPTV